MQDLHTADSLGEHVSDQVNVIFLGFLCEIEGGFAKENPWATEKTTSHPFSDTSWNILRYIPVKFQSTDNSSLILAWL